MEEIARTNQENLQAIRQLAHERRLKTNIRDERNARHPRTSSARNHVLKDGQSLNLQQEGLERELSCLMFEWHTFPKLIEEKAQIYLEEAKVFAEVNHEIVQALGRRGISLTGKEGVPVTNSIHHLAA